MQLLLPLASLLAMVAAHGYVDVPAARQAGAATTAACGKSVADTIRGDNTSHVEGLPELAAKDTGYHAAQCNLWLCKGIQFADNTANVQKYTPGQVVEFKIRLTIPHDGSANVSVVDLAANKIIGSELLYWGPTGYANEKEFYANSLPKNQTDFNVTLPDVSAQCGTAGACAIQWWWYGNGAKQTYESCVDFTMAKA